MKELVLYVTLWLVACVCPSSKAAVVVSPLPRSLAIASLADSCEFIATNRPIKFDIDIRAMSSDGSISDYTESGPNILASSYVGLRASIAGYVTDILHSRHYGADVTNIYVTVVANNVNPLLLDIYPNLQYVLDVGPTPLISSNAVYDLIADPICSISFPVNDLREFRMHVENLYGDVITNYWDQSLGSEVSSGKAYVSTNWMVIQPNIAEVDGIISGRYEITTGTESRTYTWHGDSLVAGALTQLPDKRHIAVPAPIGADITLQLSTNLIDWSNVQAATNVTANVTLLATTNSAAQQFYRAILK